MENIKRDDISIIKENKKINKRFFISSIITGAKVDEKFMQTVNNYCIKNDTELILLPMRGVSVKNTFDPDIYDRFSDNLATSFKFNSNLIAIDLMINPQQVNPLTGLHRFTQKEYSVIVASPKQILNTVPQRAGSLPHIILSTGTICKPEYRNNRPGKLAEQDNLIGGLIVEVESNKIYHIRHIQSDNKGGFHDLDTYYKGCDSKKIEVEGITIEPHYGVEDEKSLNAVKDIIKHTKCKRLFLHDMFDAGSVNHHESKDICAKYNRKPHQKDLKSELDYMSEKLRLWNKQFPTLEMFVVASNHNDFVNRYLAAGDFLQEDVNVYTASKMFTAMLDGNDPIEWYLKDNYNINNLKFLEERESFVLNGIEMNIHGHQGNNGARGSANATEISNGKATIGHSHAPSILRDVWTTGCNCQLEQRYNKGGSSWLHGSIIHHANGKRQLIIIIDGKWKI